MGTWTGFSSFSVRFSLSDNHAVHGVVAVTSPHHAFGMSDSEIGSGTLFDPGHATLHARPLYVANGIIRPSRLSTARLNLPSFSAADTKATAATQQAAT